MVILVHSIGILKMNVIGQHLRELLFWILGVVIKLVLQVHTQIENLFQDGIIVFMKTIWMVMMTRLGH